MKKSAYTLAIVFVMALIFSSCRSHQRCAAYSQAPTKTVQSPS
ncbi:MAG: hypothetical protein RIC95_00240 [Vicingaceae bacterium]